MAVGLYWGREPATASESGGREHRKKSGRKSRLLADRGARLACLLAVAAMLFSATSASSDEVLLFQQVLTGGATDAQPLPIVVALHGLGDRPESFALFFDDLGVPARVIVPRAPLPLGSDGFSWFDFPSGSDGQLEAGIDSAAKAVATLIQSLLTRYPGPRRVVVTGFSQGGMLTFALAAARPELVAEAIAVSGFLPPRLWPATRPEVRPLPHVLALHGEDDAVVPIQSARWTVEALRSNGYETRLRTFAGVGHSISREMRQVMHEAIKAAVVAQTPAPAARLSDPATPAAGTAEPAPSVAAPRESASPRQ